MNIKRYYDGVQLSPDKKQAMMARVLKQNNKKRYSRRKAWKAALAAAVAAAMILAVALPLTLGGNTATDDIAAEADRTPVQTQEAVPPVATNAPNAVVCRVVMDINPSVEFQLGEDGLIIDVVGLNEDGVALVEGIAFEGMTLENATIMVVNQLILQGYITAAEIEQEINISLTGGDMTLDALSVMSGIIETAADGHNIAVDVIADKQEGGLQIMLEGQGSPDLWPELEPEDGREQAQMEVEFVMERGSHSAFVENMLIHTADGETISILLDFVDTPLRMAALHGVVELMEKEYITDTDGDIRFFFTGDFGGSDISGVADILKLLVAEYDLKLAVEPDAEDDEIWLKVDEMAHHEAQTSKYALTDVLNFMVNKDEEDLSPRQIRILKASHNYREYLRLFEKRYFVVVPDLVGMTEKQAVDMLLQLDIVPAIVREKPVPDIMEDDAPVPDNDAMTGHDEPEPEDESVPVDEEVAIEEQTGEYSPSGFDPEREEKTAPTRDEPQDTSGYDGDGLVFYQDGHPGGMCQTGTPLQINVRVPENYNGPESIDDYREKSGFVLRAMDVPFDVSAYPDTFLLSEADGLDAMIRDMIYPMTEKSDYTVVIDRDMGWEDTAIITIAHKDGFPMSKFFVQDGRIIEHEFLWRRDVPTTEELEFGDGFKDM